MTFDDIKRIWSAAGEESPFHTSLGAMWTILFIDDCLLVFKGMAQLIRFFPQVQLLLQTAGLEINLAKSKILGAQLPDRLPACVAGIQRVRLFDSWVCL